MTLRGTILRGLIAMMVAITAGLAIGRGAVSALAPSMGAVVEGLSREYAAQVRFGTGENRDVLFLHAQFLDPAGDVRAVGVRPGTTFNIGTHLEHILVPPVLLLVVAAAWPWLTRAEALRRTLWLPFAAVASVLLTTPFLLAGQVEMWLVGQGAPRQGSWLIAWALFGEGGGRWLLGILLALCCVRLARWQSVPPAEATVRQAGRRRRSNPRAATRQ